MTLTSPLTDHPVDPPDEALVERALALVRAGTTELAPSELRVPLDYYRDPALFERERQLLRTTPLPLVPTVRLPQPHDFVVRDVLGISVLISRDGDGTAHAFLNYCRHRGARPAAGCGHARRHSCPYHGWTYDSGGRLVGIPGREGFAGVDQAGYGLVELPAEERHGFVWVVLTAGHRLDLAGHLGPLDGELASWHHETFDFLTERTFDASVNWKAALEAFAENYHFPYVHGQSIVGQNTKANTGVVDTFGAHHRLCFPLAWIEETSGTGASREPLDNLAIVYWIYPNLVLAHSTVGVELIDILPGATPGECRVVHGWMAREPATDEATEAGYHDLYAQVHHAVRDEDFGMLPSCGDGIRNAQHDHLVIGRNELAVENVVRSFAAATGFPLDS